VSHINSRACDVTETLRLPNAARKRSPPARDDIIAKRRRILDGPLPALFRHSALSQNSRTLPPSSLAFNRFPAPEILPLALLHPIFAEFVANVKVHKPTPEDHAFFRELREIMSQESYLEANQFETFRMFLHKHYQIQLDVAGTTRKTDGHIMVGTSMIVVCETWNGSGRPGVQGGLCWLDAIRKTMQRGDPQDLLPCIIIHFTGACLLPTLYPYLLFIGRSIAFSGTVFTDHVQLEILTEGFPFNTNIHEDAMPTRIARALGAFRIAVNKLREHYQNLPKLHTDERALRVTFPYPDSWTTDGAVQLTYRSPLSERGLIFLATTTAGATVLVKFTRQYSAEVHQFCAEAGEAPRLIGFRSLPTGWHMVVMEYLDPETYRVLKPSDGNNTNLVAQIRGIVTRMHNRGFVHGDIRHFNIMTRRQWTSPEGVGDVFLIDFDWAGLEGTARYPPHLNNVSVKRHEGAKDHELIVKAHDWVMLEDMLDAMGSH
jgi:hypothetical protein